jgi:DHA1 family inner membrane transport protein
VLALGALTAALAALTVVDGSFPASVVVFVVWGVAAFAGTIAVQHRLVEVDPAAAAISLSWYSTAMYVGIAVAPPLAGAALALGGAHTLPLAGAVTTAAALALFLAGFARRRPVGALPVDLPSAPADMRRSAA